MDRYPNAGRRRQGHCTGLGLRETYIHVLSARIHEAWEASRKRALGAQKAADLLANEPDIQGAVVALRGALERGAAGFRDPPLVTEELWGAVEDGHAKPSVRAAAAAALGPTLDDAGKERLRIAAGVVAAPRLRIAMEAIAGGNDEAISAALSEIDASEQHSAAPRTQGR